MLSPMKQDFLAPKHAHQARDSGQSRHILDATLAQGQLRGEVYINLANFPGLRRPSCATGLDHWRSLHRVWSRAVLLSAGNRDYARGWCPICFPPAHPQRNQDNVAAERLDEDGGISVACSLDDLVCAHMVLPRCDEE